MDKTPDVAQLSVCCGKRLVWASAATESGEVDGWGGRCPGCGMEWAELATPARRLLSTEQMLLARIAELEATLANERGEGEPPCEGWEWSQAESMPDPCWHRGESVAYMERALDTDPPTPAHFWLWWSPGMPCCQRAATARDAMRAASGAADAR